MISRCATSPRSPIPRPQAATTLSWLLAAVAGVSLLVGGIGIMNIMLVSVTERTREIGLRLAVGARQRDILAQFLIEATTLATIGGAVGIALGVAAALSIASIAGWPSVVSVDTILIAVGVSGMIGVFFGFYPAQAGGAGSIRSRRFAGSRTRMSCRDNDSLNGSNILLTARASLRLLPPTDPGFISINAWQLPSAALRPSHNARSPSAPGNAGWMATP